MPDRPERPGAEAWVPADPTLDDLTDAVQGCRGCELYRDATQAVMGQGAAGAKVVLLGEQPGEREDVEGKPFVGPAGKLLDRALADAGHDPGGVFRTNAVKHFRWSGTRGKQRIHKNPSQVHIAACGPWMVAELDLVRPEGLVLLGATAGKAVYGASFRVGEARGRLADFPPELPGHHQPAHLPRWVLATTHPAAVLRSRERDADYDRFVADLRVAAAALDGEVPASLAAVRMFVAVVPPEEALDDLDEFLDRRRDAAEFRWVLREQLHVTLAFLADVPERSLDDLEERLTRAGKRRTAFATALAGGGAFPNVGRARVLWTGLDLDDAGRIEMARLATGARAAASKAGVAVDGARFKPHVTVARLKHPQEATPWVRLLDAYRGPAWKVDHVDLVASYLGEGPRKRPRYETVGSFPLGSAP